MLKSSENEGPKARVENRVSHCQTLEQKLSENEAGQNSPLSEILFMLESCF